MIEKSLNIIAWNCHSLYSKLGHFKIRVYSERPHVICLCETWLKDSRLPQFINYTVYYECRKDKAGGGLAILVRNDVNASVLKLQNFPSGKLEVQAVTVYGVRNEKIDILNAYNPNENISENEIDFYFKQLSKNKIIIGDFNAHHEMWDSNNVRNSIGNNLVEALLKNPDLTLLTPKNFETYFHTPGRKFFTLDLCFLSAGMFSQSSIYLGDDLGSDHTPVNININFEPVLTAFKCRPKWKFTNNKDWHKWASALPDPGPIDNNSALLTYDTFIDNILTAAHSTFQQTKSVISPKYSTPWWTEDCKVAISNKRRKKNIFHRHPTRENLIELHKAEALAKKATKEAKRKSLIKFCSVLNKDTPTKQIWEYIGKFSHKRPKRQSFPLIQSDNLITTPKGKTEAIAQCYYETFNANNYNIDETSLLLPITHALTDESNLEYNSPFKMYEMESVLSKLKNNSPGEDLVHNQFLKFMPEDYKIWALKIVNDSFLKAVVPLTWKNAIICPIAKPGKPPMSPSSYRPISLLPCFMKVMEKMVCNRLSFVLEHNYAFSETQGGFRRRLSTLEQIARLENVIRHSLCDRKYCIAIFFDLSSAYDCVWHTGLLYHLAQNGIKGNILAWLQEFLRDRSYKVYFEGEFSESRKMSSGVPQGSILSPMLFNLMLSSIPRTQREKVVTFHRG